MDYLPYPPTSIPLRDLLVLRQFPIERGDHVCEVGVGTGALSLRLGRLCAEVVGIDISRATVNRAQRLASTGSNVAFEVVDVTSLSNGHRLVNAFSKVVSCDTLEHVDNPVGFFKGIASLLRPGGEFFITFPNEPLGQMHGVTRFEGRKHLEETMRHGGLSDCSIALLELTPYANKISEMLAFRPMRLVRTIVRSMPNRKVDGIESAWNRAPQTFEETAFYRNDDLWSSMSPAINAYWFFFVRLLEAEGTPFRLDGVSELPSERECQIVIRGRR